MQDELQHIKPPLWKQVKNLRQHLSDGTRAGTSPWSHSGSSRAGTLHHRGLALKLAHRNSNEGILRKALWGGDTWSHSRAAVTQRGGTRGWCQEALLCAPKCTLQTFFRQEQGWWGWPASSMPKEKGHGSKGAVGALVTTGKCAESRKNCPFSLHTQRICQPGFASSEFLLPA